MQDQFTDPDFDHSPDDEIIALKRWMKRPKLLLWPSVNT